MENLILLNTLESILGPSHRKSKENYAFHCPFCNHIKPKLEVSLVTNEKGENPFACWVCNTRGRTIKSLLIQLKVSPSVIEDTVRCIKANFSKEIIIDIGIHLPKEFEYISDNLTIEFSRVKKYLHTRGLTNEDFIKYQIGYCRSGVYSNRVIIPSYDSNGILNFFVSRLAGDLPGVPYKNPATNRDIIMFESMINWGVPVILCEGVFDAIAIKRNAIPILGKTVSKKLYEKLAYAETKDVYIALDNDAIKGALKIAENLIGLGKNVYIVDMKEKDPNTVGFLNFTTAFNEAQLLTFEKLLNYKLSV
jgi:DNA primase